MLIPITRYNAEQEANSAINLARAKKEAMIYRLIADLQKKKTLHAEMAKKGAKS